MNSITKHDADAVFAAYRSAPVDDPPEGMPDEDRLTVQTLLVAADIVAGAAGTTSEGCATVANLLKIAAGLAQDYGSDMAGYRAVADLFWLRAQEPDGVDLDPLEGIPWTYVPAGARS